MRGLQEKVKTGKNIWPRNIWMRSCWGVVFQNTSETDVNKFRYVTTFVDRLHEEYARMEPFRSSGHRTKIHITKPTPTHRQKRQHYATRTIKTSLYKPFCLITRMRRIWPLYPVQWKKQNIAYSLSTWWFDEYNPVSILKIWWMYEDKWWIWWTYLRGR